MVFVKILNVICRWPVRCANARMEVDWTGRDRTTPPPTRSSRSQTPPPRRRSAAIISVKRDAPRSCHGHPRAARATRSTVRRNAMQETVQPLAFGITLRRRTTGTAPPRARPRLHIPSAETQLSITLAPGAVRSGSGEGFTLTTGSRRDLFHELIAVSRSRHRSRTWSSPALAVLQLDGVLARTCGVGAQLASPPLC